MDDLRLDPAARRAWRGSSEVDLSAKEFALLETFMRRPGQVLSRDHLLEHAWEYDYERRSNMVGRWPQATCSTGSAGASRRASPSEGEA